MNTWIEVGAQVTTNQVFRPISTFYMIFKGSGYSEGSTPVPTPPPSPPASYIRRCRHKSSTSSRNFSMQPDLMRCSPASSCCFGHQSGLLDAGIALVHVRQRSEDADQQHQTSQCPEDIRAAEAIRCRCRVAQVGAKRCGEDVDHDFMPF